MEQAKGTAAAASDDVYEFKSVKESEPSPERKSVETTGGDAEQTETSTTPSAQVSGVGWILGVNDVCVSV